MSKKITTLVACPVCKDKQTVTTLKPNFITPSLNTVKCQMCECTYKARFSFEKGNRENLKITYVPELIITRETIPFLEKAGVNISTPETTQLSTTTLEKVNEPIPPL